MNPFDIANIWAAEHKRWLKIGHTSTGAFVRAYAFRKADHAEREVGKWVKQGVRTLMPGVP